MQLLQRHIKQYWPFFCGTDQKYKKQTAKWKREGFYLDIFLYGGQYIVY
jgi:hypothetical protein